MRVFVTGISGFLGFHLYRVLSEKGYEVLGASRRRPDFLPESCWIRLDLTDRHSVFSLELSGVDAVVHNAGVTFTRRESEYFRVNHLGTRLLVLRLQELGFSGPFVHISSLSVHGPGGAREGDAVLSPITPYGLSKLMGELEVRASSLNWRVLRPPVVFGERDMALVSLYRLFLKGVVPRWRPEKPISVVYAGNVAEAVDFLFRCREHSLYLIKDATLGWEEFALKVQSAFGVRGRFVLPLRNWMVDAFGPALSLLSRALGMPVDRHKLREVKAPGWVVESDAIREDGFVPGWGFDEALELTLKWCRMEGLV